MSGATRAGCVTSFDSSARRSKLPKPTIERLDLAGKRVFLRADLNAPLSAGQVADDARLRAVVPTIQYALKAGAAVVLASHLGRPKGRVAPELSLRPVAERLDALLGQHVELAPDCVGPETSARAHALQPGEVLLLENLRFHAEEEANDDGFARALAALADCYVNDAFAAAHRAHASIAAITKHLKPAAAGLLMQQELSALGRILESPPRSPAPARSYGTVRWASSSARRSRPGRSRSRAPSWSRPRSRSSAAAIRWPRSRRRVSRTGSVTSRRPAARFSNSSRDGHCRASRRSRRLADARTARDRQLEDARHTGRGAGPGRRNPRRAQATAGCPGCRLPAVHRARRGVGDPGRHPDPARRADLPPRRGRCPHR